MTQKTHRDEIAADLATVESLLAAVLEDDVLGRRSLKARRDILAQELATLPAQAQPSAQKGDASVRVVTDDLDRSFDVSAVLAAAERTQGTLTEEQDVPVLGEFLGVLPEQRTFEFRRDDGTVLSAEGVHVAPANPKLSCSVFTRTVHVFDPQRELSFFARRPTDGPLGMGLLVLVCRQDELTEGTSSS
jgi:hypothetical protein